METVEYFKTKRRMLKTDNDGMCTINCSTCGLSRYNNGMNIGCCAFDYLCPEKAVAIVEQWAKEHPLRTYAQDFFEKFPDNLMFNYVMILASHYYKQDIRFYPVSWREDDQVSNVKKMNQAFTVLKMAFTYFFNKLISIHPRHHNVKNS